MKTLLVPGLDGSPAPHWQHWWAATEPSALMVDLTDPTNPNPHLWEAELAGTILRHPGALVIGHSLGAILISRVLATWPQLNVRGAMMVAPADPRGQSRIEGFAPIHETELPVPTLVVASRNDPWMGFGRACQLARAWRAEVIDAGFAGHINVASGHGPWPGGKQLRDDLVAQTSPAIARRTVGGRAMLSARI